MFAKTGVPFTVLLLALLGGCLQSPETGHPLTPDDGMAGVRVVNPLDLDVNLTVSAWTLADVDAPARQVDLNVSLLVVAGFNGTLGKVPRNIAVEFRWVVNHGEPYSSDCCFNATTEGEWVFTATLVHHASEIVRPDSIEWRIRFVPSTVDSP